jgi:ATP-binding cassette, subfamily B, multidrug efflux pump
MTQRPNGAASPNSAGPSGRPSPTPGANKAVGRALGYLRAYRLETVGALVALLLVTAANLIAPRMIQIAVDDGIAKRDWNTVLVAVGGLVGVAVVRGLFTFLQGYLAERASQGVAFDLREGLFSRLQRLSFSYYDQAQTGQLVTRLTNDVEQVRTFVGSGVVQMAASAVTLMGTIVLLVLINAPLALVALLTIPPIVLLLLRFVSSVGPLFGRVQMALGKLNTILQEDLQGLRVVRAFAREDYEATRYRTANESLRDRNLETVTAIGNNFPFVVFFANLGTLAVVWFGGIQVLGQRLTVGELIAFNSYLGFLVQPILTLGFLAASISRAGASAVRVFEVLDAPLEVTDKPGAIALPSVKGQVEFSDVRFRYVGDGREILRGVSFTVQPGQVVALLGTTGSGKSTLTNLIPRFYDATGGAVLIDGLDVRDVTLESLRSQVGIVLQEALLFSGTVRENIAYGRPDANQADVETAAKAAQAHEFVQGLPNGYDTVVGERGVGLSGGQRQRIAIARALLVNPRLLILDDSTSAVDAQTEGLIQDALDRLMRAAHRTTFVIAQRVSTVRDADLILVLDEGVIKASGTHEHLLETSELYNEILGSQLRPDAPRVPSTEPVSSVPASKGGDAA